MFKPESEYVLNGGAVLQILRAPDMYLRVFYFQSSGVFKATEDIGLFNKNTLLQFCDETNELIVSRNNLFYSYSKLSSDIYDELKKLCLTETFCIIRQNGVDIDNTEFLNSLGNNHDSERSNLARRPSRP